MKRNLESMLEFFGSLDIDPTKESSSKQIFFADGYEVRYHIQTNRVGAAPTFTAVLCVYLNGYKCDQTWGCENEQENRTLIGWFAHQHSRYIATERFIEGHYQQIINQKIGK